MMHTLAPKTIALQPTSAQKSPARLDCTGRGRPRSPLTGGGSLPRAPAFAPAFPPAEGASLRKSMAYSSAGTGALGSSGTCGSSEIRNESTIAAAASADEDATTHPLAGMHPLNRGATPGRRMHLPRWRFGLVFASYERKLFLLSRRG